MFVYKCDMCKKEIKKDLEKVSVSTQGLMAQFTLCSSCGKPILQFLKKKKLLKNNEPN